MDPTQTPKLLLAFFETMAQVSVSATGLLTVAVALDGDSRDYWFSRKSHRLVAKAVLLEMLLPMFVATFGLIPPIESYFPTWPFTTPILGILYMAFTLFLRNSSKDSGTHEALKELGKKLGLNLIAEMTAMSTLTIIFGVYGWSSYRVSNYDWIVRAETALAILLCVIVLAAVLTAINMLQVQPEIGLTKQNNDRSISTEEITITSQKRHNLSRKKLGLVPIFLAVSGLVVSLGLLVWFGSTESER